MPAARHHAGTAARVAAFQNLPATGSPSIQDCADPPGQLCQPVENPRHTMTANPQEPQDIPEASPAPTTRLDSPAPTVRLEDRDAEAAPMSFFQHALEITAPIVAFLAVAVLTAPLSEAILEEMPGTIPATVVMILRALIAYKAARAAARWVAR
jgi:hypothetical protein